QRRVFEQHQGVEIGLLAQRLRLKSHRPKGVVILHVTAQTYGDNVVHDDGPNSFSRGTLPYRGGGRRPAPGGSGGRGGQIRALLCQVPRQRSEDVLEQRLRRHVGPLLCFAKRGVDVGQQRRVQHD